EVVKTARHGSEARCATGHTNAELPNCEVFLLGTSCAEPGQPLDSLARRARNVTRTKPSPRAVGGSRRSTRTVDESEIGSANEEAPSGGLLRFWGALFL